MSEATAPGSDPASRPRWGARLRRVLRAFLLLVGIPVSFAIVAALGLLGREVSAPSWVTAQVEARGADLLGGDLDFAGIKVTLGTDLHPRVALVGAVVRDAAGQTLARIPRIEAMLSPRGLILGREVMVQEVTLTGAQIGVRRDRSGTFEVAFEGAGGGVGGAESFGALLGGIDALFDRPRLAALEQVTAEGLIVNFDDARAGRSWTVDGGRLHLDLRGGETALRGDVTLLSGRSFATRLAVSYESPRDSLAARIGLEVEQAAAADIATQSAALSWLSVLDAPLSAAIRAEVDEAGAIGPLNATLEIGAGALRPTRATTPVHFDSAKTYLTYDPAKAELRFDQVEVQSDWGEVLAEGRAYLREMEEGIPGALVGQFRLNRMRVNPAALYDAPHVLDGTEADVRLRLDPFELRIGQLRVPQEAGALNLRGTVAAAPEGWTVAIDGRAEALGSQSLMTFWPESFRSRTRGWFADNILGGTLFNIAGGLRLAPGAAPVGSLDFEYRDAAILVLGTMPPIEGAAGFGQFADGGFALSIDAGGITAPEGGRLDLAGSVMTIPDLAVPDPPARFDLAAAGTVTATLAMLDLPPLGLLSRANLPVTLADGQAEIAGSLDLPLGGRPPPGTLSYDMTATVTGVRSAALVPGRVLTSDRLRIAADPEGMTLEGPVRVGQVPMRATLRQPFTPGDRDRTRIEATTELSPGFLDEFGIALPPGSLRGTGQGQLSLILDRGAAPRFALVSDLQGLTLRLPAVGWSKGPGQDGRLEVSGTLGARPAVERLTLDAAGLSAAGEVRLAEGGGLELARFDRLRVGDWLDATVELRGRGPGRPVGLAVTGGTLDMRRAAFGEGGGESGGSGPMEVTLDRLEITEGIALTGFRGDFTPGASLSGPFTARVNGGPQVRGTLLPTGRSSAVRLLSEDAGGVLRAAGFLENALDGTLDLILSPTGDDGTFDGQVSIRDLRVRDAPALASLIDAISVVGLLQQLDGRGLSFSEVDANFRLSPERIIVTESSATGPSMGISLDGIYRLADKRMDFQGVVSPFYLINGIGSVLTRPGEGLIGFNFNLQGTSEDPRVIVNPLSAVTPGFLREMFRRPPPRVPGQ